ncbi:RNA polymerase sigma factor [Aureispira anguillae]|uniref:Sigma-70 family RNA polymerase sigma factor n=1 Tax=Aureispira anguillae TaxID=2864201 RepID=A0A915YF81_9BACT|nr:sigma-70 family RNA polymerase sigma factor [Aureispira anguillae]BDS12029.1 sigma-70 family RNA polymerase sigma factor [Aureispira anguillae]
MTLKEFTYQLVGLKDKLFRFSARIVGNDELAEDVVQDVVIKMWNKREERDQYENLESYCMRLTKNLSIDKTRAKNYQNIGLDKAPEPIQEALNPYQQTAHKDTISHIHQLMQNLSHKQRMVMQLRDIEGMEYQEIAQILEIPLNQVKVNLFRARKSIRKQLLNIESYGL